jgi:hypothetical protein
MAPFLGRICPELASGGGSMAPTANHAMAWQDPGPSHGDSRGEVLSSKCNSFFTNTLKLVIHKA